ncbi:MAG: Y_Y_Y domain protein [Methanomassiliicoccales archaeon PtaU1.Bin124]|nr:MAG: Y_Y_Y domain protein [Methanomassiliicoccales archaeon PtaU1.Bin124]
MRTIIGKSIAVAIALIMIFGVILVMPSGTSAPAPGWTAIKAYAKPDPLSSWGVVENSIALDSHGHVHIAFAFGTSNNDNVLMHTTNASGAWVAEVVDNTVDSGYYPSIAIDSNDHIHIAHYSYNERGLRYATNAGGTWVNQTVVSRIDISDGMYRADAQYGLSLAVDSAGIPYIAYSSQTSPGTYEGRHFDLNMAVKMGGVWSFETITGVTGGDLYLKKSLVLDSSKHAHIAYSQSTKLYYATNESGSWAMQMLDNQYENGWEHYIALDGLGHVGISYLTNNTTPPLNLKYATNAGGSWVNETIVSSNSLVRPTQLGYDSSGYPCIMVFRNSMVSLYSKTSGGTWTETNPLGTSTTISVNMFMMADDHGKFHVSYAEYNDLWYVTNSIPSDVTAPSISITSPSSSGSYSTYSSTVTVSGTASDDIGVTSVTWTNDRGGSGTATGTGSWSTGSITLQTGDNVITATAHDASGKSTDVSITITYTPDIVDPSVMITSPTDAIAYTTDVDHIALAGTASDNVGVASVTCHNNANGADATIAGTTSWSTSSDMPLVLGENIIVVTANDANGNSATDTITVTYAVDTTVPMVTITAPGDDFATNVVTVAVTWTGSDNVGVVGYKYRLDGGVWSGMTTDTTYTFGGLAEGAHTVDVRAYDARENNATATVHFTVDLVSPILGISAPTDGALIGSPTVSWSGADTLSGISHYLVRVDNGTWSGQLQSTSYAFTNLADGPHQAQIRAYDRAGNYVERVVNFTLDATAPVLSITEPSSGFATNETSVTVEWGASDAISGLAGYRFRIDGGSWSDLSSTVSYEFADLSNGQHNVTVRAVDNLGNTAERYIVFTVDTMMPTLSIISPANNTHYNVANVAVSWSASDQHSGIQGYRYRLDGGAWSLFALTTGQTFTGLSEGTHILEIEALDNASNSAKVSMTFFVDITSPSVSISSPTANATYTTNASALSLSGASTDNIGVIEVTWANSQGGSGTATMSSTGWTISGITLKAGSNVITVTARDASNNTATSTLTVTYTPDSVKAAGLDMGIIAIILAAVLAAIVGVVFFIRRRKK